MSGNEGRINIGTHVVRKDPASTRVQFSMAPPLCGGAHTLSVMQMSREELLAAARRRGAVAESKRQAAATKSQEDAAKARNAARNGFSGVVTQAG